MTPDRLARIKARLHSTALYNIALQDISDLITALEAAQERIATLEAEVQRVTSDQQFIIGHNAGFDDAWAQRGEEIGTLQNQIDALRKTLSRVPNALK